MNRTRTALVTGAVALLVAALTLLPTSVASAATVTTVIGGVTYSADDTNVAAGASAVSYAGAGGALVIPSTVTIGVDVYSVVAVADEAFDPLGGGATATGLLASVTLPSTLESIGSNAFARNALTSITIPDSVTSLGGGAFFGNALTSITLGAGISVIPISAFAVNPTLTSLTLPNTVTSIGVAAFEGDSSLSSVVIPSSVTVIGDRAFNGTALSSVRIPDSVTFMGDQVFISPTLTTVRFDGDVPTLGTAPFGANPGAPTVSFLWRNTASGFTTPTWAGYPSVAIALVEFDGNGGSTPSTQEVAVGAPAANPGPSSRPGYGFTGWFTAATGGSQYNFSTPVTADVALFAQFGLLPAMGTDVSPVVPIGAGLMLIGGLAFVALARRRSASSAS